MFWSQHLGCWGQNTSRIQNKGVYATLCLQAETLKYLFLLFSDDDTMSLHEYVFTTEAHPLKRRSPKPYHAPAHDPAAVPRQLRAPPAPPPKKTPRAQGSQGQGGGGSWAVCAVEGNTCTCTGAVLYGRRLVSDKTGDKRVASYKLMASRAHKLAKATGTIECTSAAMNGDPAPGFVKHCLCQRTPKRAVTAPNGHSAPPLLDARSPFWLGLTGHNACPHGSEKIVTTAECDKAAKMLGLHVSSDAGIRGDLVLSNSKDPGGCFNFDWGGGKHAYFNHHKGAGSKGTCPCIIGDSCAVILCCPSPNMLWCVCV